MDFNKLSRVTDSIKSEGKSLKDAWATMSPSRKKKILDAAKQRRTSEAAKRRKISDAANRGSIRTSRSIRSRISDSLKGDIKSAISSFSKWKVGELDDDYGCVVYKGKLDEDFNPRSMDSELKKQAKDILAALKKNVKNLRDCWIADDPGELKIEFRLKSAKKDSLASRSSRRVKRIKDSKAYNRIKRRIKDALEETESTEEAIEAAVGSLDEGAPADQVLSAVVEILGDVIDELQGEDPESEDEYEDGSESED